MSHIGAQITGVRELTEDEVLGTFARHRETVPALELDDGASIFPTGDEEANRVGEWPVSQDELAKYVGMYVMYWKNPNPDNIQQASIEREPIQLLLGEEPPKIHDSGELEFDHAEAVALVPHGQGVGPAAWHLREEADPEEGPDPDTTPTPEEVMEMYENGEIDSGEFSDQLHNAERAHSDATFAGIF